MEVVTARNGLVDLFSFYDIYKMCIIPTIDRKYSCHKYRNRCVSVLCKHVYRIMRASSIEYDRKTTQQLQAPMESQEIF
jgi:hypothetical protein